ncbi:hypothetical protein ABZT03_42500 [Streptomyces sp. NPDC005574]|uniref:hypothetical protein n=1 Tax=Streptomyces sp. NPDC005574 TaxID=3156891 RepID=UPI0033B5FC36
MQGLEGAPQGAGVDNSELRDALYQAAFCSLTQSPGAHAFYRRQRERGIPHNAALRNLGARPRCLFHCLHSHVPYDERDAFPARQEADPP